MRLCYNCTYIYFATGTPDYSDMTPGDDAHMYCEKYHWDLKLEGISYSNKPTLTLREALETAQTCPDYEQSDEAKKLQIGD